MTAKLEFDGTEFDIKKYLADLRHHRTHIYPAELDDFCNILKPRTAAITVDYLFVELDVTLLSGNRLQQLVDVIEPYILVDKDYEVDLSGKKILIQFKKLKSTN